MPYPVFRVGEPLHSGCDLRVRDAFEEREDGEEARPINRGATGVVLRVIQADTIERAVKLLAPEDALFAYGNWDYFMQVFEREKRKLAALTHSNLAKLISFGTIHLDASMYEAGDPPAIPYIVMEFVEGKPIHQFIAAAVESEDPSKLVDTVLDLFDDILSALQYLHKQEAFHSDVKEANILVRRTHRPEAVLVDLGATHVFTRPESDNTRYVTTPSRVSRIWKDRVNKDVPAGLLKENRVVLDLYMLGAMLRLFLDKDLPDDRARYDWQPLVFEALRGILGDLGVVVLDRVADKCLQEKYASAAEVRQDLAAIRQGFVAPLGIPELSMGTNTRSSLATPEDSVPLTDRIRAVLNHPCVQRLRMIPQLDFVELIYLGATHTRLLHSLETFNLARRYIGKLLGDPIFRAYAAEPAKLEAALLASLLHDIGHYPLEHIFEDFALRSEAAGPFVNILRDEEVTSVLLGRVTRETLFVRDSAVSYLAECQKILRLDALVPLEELIAQRFGSLVLNYLQRILDRDEELDPGISILRSIINGPLDVDKAAYLRADSRHSGVAYGQAIDIDSLLASLTCVVYGEPVVAITEKAICAAESIVTSRRWMFQRIYWHRANRAIMAMIRFAPQYLLERGHIRFSDYFSGVYHLSHIEALKWLDAKLRPHPLRERSRISRAGHFAFLRHCDPDVLPRARHRPTSTLSTKASRRPSPSTESYWLALSNPGRRSVSSRSGLSRIARKLEANWKRGKVGEPLDRIAPLD
jgi:HD superfamily phosphohydrolase